MTSWSIKQSVGVLCLFAAVTVLGCGPVFHTEYLLTPPESESGKMCTYQCENLKQQCRQIEQMRADQCTQRSQLERELCEQRIYRYENRNAKWYECSSSTCSADYEQCEASFRSCYQGCGGTVRAETSCVSNCEEVGK